MTEPVPAFSAPAFAVFADRKATTPIFVAIGTEPDAPFAQACAFARGYNGDRNTGRAIIRRASAAVIFGREVKAS